MFQDIDVVRWDVTRRCNLNCRHCYASELSAKGYPELTLAQAAVVAKKLGEAGCRSVGLLGGEPFLRSDLLDICDLFAEQGIRVAVTTNGTLLHDGIFDRLNVSLEPSRLTFSFSGHTPELHEAVHGAGTFNKLVSSVHKALSWANRNSVRTVSANVVVNAKLAPRLPELIHWLDGLGVERILLEDVAWVGAAVAHHDELYLDADELLDQLLHVAAAKAANDVKAEVSFFCLPPLARDYVVNQTGLDISATVFGCPLPNELYLSSHGCLYPCQQLHELEAQNVPWIVDISDNDLLTSEVETILVVSRQVV